MKRRDFLKRVAGASALAVCATADTLGNANAAAVGKPQASEQLIPVALAGVTKGAAAEAIKAAVREAALAVSDFSWLSGGETVFIKPALNSGFSYPSTTSPTAVAAMVALLKEKGAGRVIVGDMAGIEHVKLTSQGLTGSTRKLMDTSGMARAVTKAGGELHFFEEAGWNAFYEDPMTAGSHWKRGLMMPNILREVDHIVLMPRCGRHVLAGSTLGLKAAVGYWRTDTRLEYHRDAATLHEKTAEANSARTLLRKQRLVISAADRVLTTFGPDKGYVQEPETGLIIASASVVAHDMISLAWLLENRQHIPSDKKDGFVDMNPIVARMANYWVVAKLGGLKPAIASDRLIKNDLKTIWEDRVLNRAYQIFGGTPKLALHSIGVPLPGDLKSRLAAMTAV